MTVWFATAILLLTAILVLFGRALWLGITAHTLKKRGTFPVTSAKRASRTRINSRVFLTNRNFHVPLR
jgi:hypothetical protein